jgi:A/G-specific adenine glycosylase
VKEGIETNQQPIDVEAFRSLLINWGKENFRAFPWRMSSDPYQILMAEVMLHRTQAKQVVSVFNEFVERYPTISSVAQASLDELHEILYSLGLRWRIDLIHQMSVEVMQQHSGVIPRRREALLDLPGVSDYIAGAVRCFAWNLPEPVLDTNTVRVMGRIFGLDVKDSSRRSRQFRELASTLLDPLSPREFNYALLDLADSVCTKKQEPKCNRCPLLRWCLYGLTKMASGKKAIPDIEREKLQR